MATNDIHSGTLRTDYETDLAHPDELRAMESEWQRLMHRTVRYGKSLDYRDDDGREGTLAPLLENHVLTVVADIMRKRLSGYGESFADAQGTIGETAFEGKLGADIERWIARLEAFIGKSWKTGRNESPAVAVAVQIRDSLEKSLPAKDEAEKQGYYRMLRTVRSIQEHAGYYLEQIESGGDVDGTLSLLVAFVKNYCGIARSFDNRLAGLPALYRNDILHVKPEAVVQDNAYIIVRPTEKCTLKAGQGFAAGQNAEGEDLMYRTTKDETVSPMQCAEVEAVYLVKNEVGRTTGIRRQIVNPEDALTATTLFDAGQGETLAFGWQIESAMFIMNEGEREVNVSFDIKAGTAAVLPPDGQEIKGFTFHLSSEDGWAEQDGKCFAGGGKLCFSFTIGRDGTLPAACSEETHGKRTDYPVLRILTAEENCPYDLASRIETGGVEIRTHVKGIRNFTFYNELGEVDTTQPFQPFGIQGERGAWFLFGNEEMGMKPLTGVRLKGIWQKIPDTKKEFDDRYKVYGVNAASFRISTEWQEKENWHMCQDEPQPLFRFDGEGKLCPADIHFDFPGQNAVMHLSGTRYDYGRDKDGFFRATLHSPSIGFGTDEYRKRFTDIMIHNSRCKEKHRKELPQEPLVPVLADVELEYEAVERMPATPEPELIALPDGSETCFKSRPANGEDKALYFSFIHAAGERNLRMYLDMALPKEKIPFRMSEPTKGVSLTWEYRKGNVWTELPAGSVTSEETCGLTQSGFIEIRLPEKLAESGMDRDVRLRVSVKGDTDSCLAIRGVWTNCILLTAQNGDGQPLPAGTIQEMPEADGRIESITQPLSGFGGRPAATESGLSAHLTSRIGNRHRAVNVRDYEQIVLEHFPEVDKAVCLPCSEKGKQTVYLIVFSRSEDGQYYLSPSWKLTEIERTVRQYVSPFVRLKVMNPVYQEIRVFCKAVLRENVRDEGKVIRNLTVLARNYLAPWKSKGEIPELQQSFSYKELHSRMANHEDLQAVAELRVGNASLSIVNFNSEDIEIKGSHPWNVLIPKIEIILLSPDYGIENIEIGSSFIIK